MQVSAEAELGSSPQPLFSQDTLGALANAERLYASIADSSGWPTIPAGPNLPTMLLAERLSRSMDIPARPVSDREVVEGIRRFQARHGLVPTGELDPRTIAALNVPADARLAQIRANLERIRDGIKTIGSSRRYVVVNVPAYQLEAIENGGVARRHRVIVGKVGRETPNVFASILAVNFFPFWNVPESVARLDLIPHLKNDPEYLVRQHIRVFSGAEEVSAQRVNWGAPDVQRFRFRQDPGPWNALGLLRLDMQNQYSVYMHDTPMKQLFGRSDRTYSAGCVRVENVSDLAAWILKETTSRSRASVEEALASNTPQDIHLARPMPVAFTYVTAWAGPRGIEFRDDVYGRDGGRTWLAATSPSATSQHSVGP